MKIVVADSLPAAALDLLRAETGWTVDANARRSKADLVAALTDADALLVRSATKVDDDLLAGARRLKVVARAGTRGASGGARARPRARAWRCGWHTRQAPAASAAPTTRAR